jgi:general L-amino acid transport system permease protein
VTRAGGRWGARDALLQALALGVAAALLWWLAGNASQRMASRGIALGFDFLERPANFAIGETPVAYSPTDTFGRAILVGLVNTLRVSVAGWVLSIVLGFVLGVMRLSENPVVRGLVRSVVEVLRNTPLLLLLLFLAATLRALPAPREALEPLAGVYLSDRGLVLPYPAASGLQWALGATLVVLLAAGRSLGRWRWALTGAAAAALATSMMTAWPVWDRPRATTFGFAGGLTMSPELAALLAALVLHHGAHVSEVVRGAVLAVPRGQREAAYALGLSRFQAARFVVVPQALRAMVPLLAANCVSLTKNSSLAVAIGFPDVVSVLNTTSNQTGHAIETMFIMLVVYLVMSLGTAAALGGYNRRVLRAVR